MQSVNPRSAIRNTEMQCATHPGTETFLRCGKCERPICPRCMVDTPVGARCRECVSDRPSPLYQAEPRQYLLAALASVAAGLALGWLPGLIMLLGPVMYGFAVGEAALRAGSRRRGPGMQAIAGIAALVGVLFWSLGGPNHIARVLAALPPSGFLALLANPFTLLALALSVGFAVLHVRSI